MCPDRVHYRKRYVTIYKLVRRGWRDTAARRHGRHSAAVYCGLGRDHRPPSLDANPTTSHDNLCT